jgi:hypothetical protein
MGSLVIACSDGRLTETLERFQSRRRAQTADRLLVPGGPLVLTRPGMERRVALECIRTLVEAGNARCVHLLSHQDCNAYEREILERDLRRVRTLLENELPGVEIVCWVIPWLEGEAGTAAFGDPESVS